MSSHISNKRPAPDQVLTDIADYALNYKIESDLAYTTAHLLPHRYAGLRPRSSRISRLHQAARAHRARNR